MAGRDQPVLDVLKPPRQPLGKRLFDILLWGGIVVLLLISFGPTQISRLSLVFTHSENMREYGAQFLKPDFSLWRLYVEQMWLTVQMALWGTFLAILIAIPFGLACSRNLSPPWLQQPCRLLMNLLRAAPIKPSTVADRALDSKR